MVNLKSDQEIKIMAEGGKKLKAVVKELMPLIKKGITTKEIDSKAEELIKKQDISSTIRGRININSQISDLMNQAESEVILCAPVSEVKNRIKLLEPLIKQISDSKKRLIVALSGEDNEIRSINEKLGIKAKKIEVNASFYIADKKQILFMLNNSEDNNEQMAVWFASPFFVQSFTTLFDTALKRGK